MYMLMPGKVFFLSGEEFCRSKMGEENSYNLPLSVNAINWENVDTYRDMVSYYKKLIALRKSLSALNKKEGPSEIKKTFCRRGAIGFKVHEGTKEILVVFNAREKSFRLRMTKGEWKVLLCSDSSFHPDTKLLPAKCAVVLESVSN